MTTKNIFQPPAQIIDGKRYICIRPYKVTVLDHDLRKRGHEQIPSTLWNGASGQSFVDNNGLEWFSEVPDGEEMADRILANIDWFLEKARERQAIFREIKSRTRNMVQKLPPLMIKAPYSEDVLVHLDNLRKDFDSFLSYAYLAMTCDDIVVARLEAILAEFNWIDKDLSQRYVNSLLKPPSYLINLLKEGGWVSEQKTLQIPFTERLLIVDGEIELDVTSSLDMQVWGELMRQDPPTDQLNSFLKLRHVTPIIYQMSQENIFVGKPIMSCINYVIDRMASACLSAKAITHSQDVLDFNYQQLVSSYQRALRELGATGKPKSNKTSPVPEQALDTQKYVVFAGRWQPWHFGHQWSLDWALRYFSHVIIGIVNPNPSKPPVSEKEWDPFLHSLNPLAYWERYRILWTYLKREGLLEKVDMVPLWHPKMSLERERYYLPPVAERIWLISIARETDYGKVKGLEELGEKVLAPHPPSDFLSYEAGRVRQAIQASSPGWLRQVPDFVSEQLDELGATDRIRSNLQTSCEDPLSYTIFPSRFQPLNNQEAWMIRKLAIAECPIIAVMNPELSTDSRDLLSHPGLNPFTYWERLQMIKGFLLEEGLLEKIMIIPFPSDDSWKAMVPSKRSWLFSESLTEYTRLDQLLQAGENVSTVRVPKSIRDLSLIVVQTHMRLGHAWNSLVPTAVSTSLEISGPARVRTLYAQFAADEQLRSIVETAKIPEIAEHRKKGERKMDNLQELIRLNADVQALHNSISNLDQQRERGWIPQPDYVLQRRDLDRQSTEQLSRLSLILEKSNRDDLREFQSILSDFQEGQSPSIESVKEKLVAMGQKHNWGAKVMQFVHQYKGEAISLIISIATELMKQKMGA